MGKALDLTVTGRTYSLRAKCPDCSHDDEGALCEVWGTMPSVDMPGCLVRMDRCRECGCWFEETIRPNLRSCSYETLLEDGGTRNGMLRRAVEVGGPCPICGKGDISEDEDPYWLEEGWDEDLGFFLWEDTQNRRMRRRKHCAECHTSFDEVYGMEQVGERAMRHGQGDPRLAGCPVCGSDSYQLTTLAEPVGDDCFRITCRCDDCGTIWSALTKERFNHVEVYLDRDDPRQESGFDQTLWDRTDGVGSVCPLCGKGVLVARSEPLGSADEITRRGMRGTRSEGYECPSCYAELTEWFATQVVSRKVLREGTPGSGGNRSTENSPRVPSPFEAYDEDVPF